MFTGSSNYVAIDRITSQELISAEGNHLRKYNMLSGAVFTAWSTQTNPWPELSWIPLYETITPAVFLLDFKVEHSGYRDYYSPMKYFGLDYQSHLYKAVGE